MNPGHAGRKTPLRFETNLSAGAISSNTPCGDHATMRRMNPFHLAQFNIAHCRGPLDTPVMRGFVEQIDAMNRIADGSAGFIWRLQSYQGDATGIRVYDDPLIVITMSLWRSVEDLKNYVYRSAHSAAFRNRREWFHDVEGASLALWWHPAGDPPPPEEGRRRLEHLDRHGPTAHAFTFKAPFPAPDQGVGPERDGLASSLRRASCP